MYLGRVAHKYREILLPRLLDYILEKSNFAIEKRRPIACISKVLAVNSICNHRLESCLHAVPARADQVAPIFLMFASVRGAQLQ